MQKFISIAVFLAIFAVIQAQTKTSATGNNSKDVDEHINRKHYNEHLEKLVERSNSNKKRKKFRKPKEVVEEDDDFDGLEVDDLVGTEDVDPESTEDDGPVPTMYNKKKRHRYSYKRPAGHKRGTPIPPSKAREVAVMKYYNKLLQSLLINGVPVFQKTGPLKFPKKKKFD
ncbi:hypothetical protein PYW08_012836 [Mythimna loreyi]|uniref:Uncharacterized protein n=1 Tax=Mythimna loreyi TaxID=667449 RepID=A0ACC2Q1U3_9NEOP|nr:hypothetical protein PYW08_012836 [Mythimna loreyi]